MPAAGRLSKATRGAAQTIDIESSARRSLPDGNGGGSSGKRSSTLRRQAAQRPQPYAPDLPLPVAS